MRASILLPTFNEEAMIGSVVRNARQQQTAFPYEVIIADGGSTDQTRKITEDLGVTVLHCPRRGKVDQIN
ncbi:MAG: glycosyltransferase, partial [Promethearchaeota archaeon]